MVPPPMALVSPASATLDRQSNMTRNSTSSAGDSCANMAEIEEELLMAASSRRSSSSYLSRTNSMKSMDGGDFEDPLYIAVGKEYKEGKSTLMWALRHNRRVKKFVLVHIHCPSQMIPISGGWFQVNQLKPEQVEAYRNREREKMTRTLDEYVFICEIAKVQVEKLIIEADDVAKGLLVLIAQHEITRLVMGAAADKYYSKTKKLIIPLSKTARAVLKEAPLYCDIWFVCKGNLIFTRGGLSDGYEIPDSPMASPSAYARSPLFRSDSTEAFTTGSSLRDLDRMTKSRNRSSFGEELADPSPEANGDATALHATYSRSSLSQSESAEDCMIGAPMRDLYPMDKSRNRGSLGEELAGPLLEADGDATTFPVRFSDVSQISSYMQDTEPRFSQSSNLSISDELDKSNFEYAPKDEGGNPTGLSFDLRSTEQSEDKSIISSTRPEDVLRVDDDWNGYLEQAITEAAKLINGAYMESHKRLKAEREALDANNRVKELDRKYVKEIKQREEIEEMFARRNLEVERLKGRLDEVLEELNRAQEQKSIMETKVTESDHAVKSLEEKLSTVQQLLNSLQFEHDQLLRERNMNTHETSEMQRTKELDGSTSLMEFTSLELEQATCNFESSLKLGEGWSGPVYKGFLRRSSVAIKVLHAELHSQVEFRQEVENLSKLRHPNLVTLIGACSENWSLVYEYCPKRSLEDLLDSKTNTSPLPWQVRLRVSAEICSALIFLHANKPQSVVHGDLRPSNILFDANFRSKVTDFGISRLLTQSSSTLYNWTDPKGSFVYLDPEFFSTGELNTRSDIYSYGIILLRLLTGRPALGIVKDVQEALERGRLQSVIDPAAGDWPAVLAQQLAHLGLRCCEMKRKNRPDLTRDVWKVLEPMEMASMTLPSSGLNGQDGSSRPNFKEGFGGYRK